MDFVACVLLLGIGATAVTDLWALARKRLLGIAPPDFGLVGRWLAGMTRGRLRHESIAAAPAVRGERLLGWTAHYLVGIAFAGALLGIWGLVWIRHPTLAPALLVGVATVAAPILVMQPGMGLGFSAVRAMHSLVTHLVFGVGLYAAGWISNFILCQEIDMRIPARFAPMLLGALQSVSMVNAGS